MSTKSNPTPTTTRYVLITGCSAGGQGEALVKEYAKRPDHHVFATARTPTKVSYAANLSNVTVLTLDILSSDSIRACVEEVSRRTAGVLHCLFNNAGVFCVGMLAEMPLEAVRQNFELNVTAPIAVTQAFLPLLKAAPGGSQLVFNSSIAAAVSMPAQGAYGAAKSAISSVAAAMRTELAPFGVQVVDLRSGLTQSEAWNNSFGQTIIGPDSAYVDVKFKVERYMNGETPDIAAGRWSAADHATAVVRELAKPAASASPVMWIGGLAWKVKLMSMLAPYSVIDKFANEASGMDDLAKIVKQKKEKKMTTEQ